MSISSRSRRKCLATGSSLTSVPLVLLRSSRKESARIVTTTACSPLTARFGRTTSLPARRPIVRRSRSSGISSVLSSGRNRTSLLISLRRLLREPPLQPRRAGQELRRHADQHHGDVVASAVLIRDVDQFRRRLGEVRPLGDNDFADRIGV